MASQVEQFEGADDLEPRIRTLMEQRLIKRTRAPYRTLAEADIGARLQALIRASGVENFTVSGIARMAGGASKEQFSFILEQSGAAPERLVLRIDPLESIIETCRYREAEVIAAVAPDVPVATVRFLDGEGTYLGQPGVVTSFVQGITKPPQDGEMRVSGVGTVFTQEWRDRLAPQFITYLARIHATDWRRAHLPHFSAPVAYPEQAAMWAVNWWANVWRFDLLDHYPLLSLAERWMRERLPKCEDPVLLHGDYRTGNFMFDEQTGQMTAVLDWELTHIGDFHDDLGWIMLRLFGGPAEDGQIKVCSLFTRDELIGLYEEATGRVVNRDTLAFYQVLNSYKCGVMNLGSGYGASLRQSNHQDILLSQLACVGHVFINEIAEIISTTELPQ